MSTIPTHEIVNVTPELATTWLEGQAPNRSIKKAKIEKFARDMSAGRWLFTGEPFGFDTAGRMIDGQNRCHAIIKSGVTVQALVVRGLALEAQSVMDQGTSRSSRDALTFAGYSKVKDLAASIVVHRAWKAGELMDAMSHVPNVTRPTNAEVVDYAQAHPGLEWASQEAKRLYSLGLRVPVGSIATAIMEFREIDVAASDDFFDRVIALRTDGPGDPVHTLIRRVQQMWDTPGIRLAPATGLFFLFRTWNAVRTGQQLKKLQLGKAPNWVAIPEPK